MNKELYHEGVERRSGRYPWGSGKDPYQHEGRVLLDRINQTKQKNPSWGDKELSKAFNMSINELRSLRGSVRDETIAAERRRADYLVNTRQMSKKAAAEKMGISEGTLANRLKEPMSNRTKQIDDGAKVLKKAISKSKYVDISTGSAERIGLNPTRLARVVDKLKDEGYSINKVQVRQMNTGKFTTLKVISPPGTEWKEVANNTDKIKLIDAYESHDDKTLRNIEKPVSVDSKRVKIRYADEGGLDKDGVIELRRGVDDISLKNANYAQVRIAVDGDHYLKGMAIYSDNIPKGYDIVFNTNKHKDTPKLDVIKKMKTKKDGSIDEDNPFGATIKPTETLIKAQRFYTDDKGKRKQSAINIVNEEGDWETWSKTLSSQFLSKQSPDLIKKQLNYTYDEKVAELKDIKDLTNPVLKKHLLTKFADGCDYDAVHMKAASLPRQASHVILPLKNIAKDQVYAPNYKNGEKVALVRYPHGGQFEIPKLTVNNNVPEGKRVLKSAPDAIGIHPSVAGILSGADFDGDTVIVIPTNSRVHIDNQKPLKDLEGFEPKEAYKGYPGMRKMTNTQTEMGKISNLITDMHLKGADSKEIARAVKHSMVVIDAEKHGLDYTQSMKDNNISALKKKYQGKSNGGASTILSRSKSKAYEPQVKYTKINKDTGELEKVYSNKLIQKYVDPKTGKEIKTSSLEKDAKGKPIRVGGVWVKGPEKVQQETSKMALAKDARELMSSNPNKKELYYANYANKMKIMANEARKEAMNVNLGKKDPRVSKTYASEIKSLDQKLNAVAKQRPLERQAQIIANDYLKSALEEDPTLFVDKDHYKKVKYQALEGSRYKVGKKKTNVDIKDDEWKAIQANAISPTKVKLLFEASDLDSLKKKATPRKTSGLSNAKVSRIKAMINSGNYTQAEIADVLGVSVSTIRSYT